MRSVPFAPPTDEPQAARTSDPWRGSQERERPAPLQPEADDFREQPPIEAEPAGEQRSSFAGDPLALLWRNADDQPTGTEAVEALRARRRR